MKKLWRRALYYATLPVFTAASYGMTALEGLLWLVYHPGDAWSLIKEWLGLIE